MPASGRPKAHKSEEDHLQSLLSGLVDDVNDYLGDLEELPNIIEFKDNVLDLGIKLTKEQDIILKVAGGLELSVSDISILECWNLEGRTTWTRDQHKTKFQNIILESGRRSGKSTIAAIIVSYLYYILCRLPNPQEYYNISTSSRIGILTIATTAEQSEKTIFGEVTNMLRGSAFFRRLADDGVLFIGKKSVAHEDKQLYIYSGNSRSGAQVGGNLIALAMDEVARFEGNDGVNNALELWHNLGASLTPFGTDALKIAISSAWCDGDAIQVLRERSSNSPAAFVLATRSWDLNPVHAGRDNAIVAAAYAEDPRKAALEFEGKRFGALEAFLNYDEIQRAWRGVSTVQAQPSELIDQDMILSCVEINRVEPAPIGTETVLHIDPAVKKDAYGMAYGHGELDESGRIIVYIDGILAWEPSPLKEVSITDVLGAIQTIHADRPLSLVTADHHQQQESLQRLRMQGIKGETIHFSNKIQMEMYTIVRALLHEDRLILPADANVGWRGLLNNELARILLINGVKIDHPKGSTESKDLADCIAAVAWKICARTKYLYPKSHPTIYDSSGPNFQINAKAFQSAPRLGSPSQERAYSVASYRQRTRSRIDKQLRPPSGNSYDGGSTYPQSP